MSQHDYLPFAVDKIPVSTDRSRFIPEVRPFWIFDAFRCSRCGLLKASGDWSDPEEGSVEGHRYGWWSRDGRLQWKEGSEPCVEGTRYGWPSDKTADRHGTTIREFDPTGGRWMAVLPADPEAEA